MSLFWSFYTLVFWAISWININTILNPQTTINQYYQLLSQLQPLHIFSYAAAIIYCVLNILTAIIVTAYTFKLRVPMLTLPSLFWARLCFEFLGHQYEFQYIKSAFYHSTFFGFSALLLTFVITIPSYIAHARFISNTLKKN